MTTANLKFYFLRDRQFDSLFMTLPFMAGILFSALCIYHPQLFPVIFLLDLWLLGYHHVISTYTRISFDWESAKKHSFLVFVLPFIVFVVNISLYNSMGSWIISSIYLYWQWFHYTRQSYGISRYYLARESKETAKQSPLSDRINTIALYSLPITGILYRSFQNPQTFLSMPIKTFPVPYEVFLFSAAISAIAITIQFYKWWKLYQNGELHGNYVIYILSHYLIFLAGYIIIDDITFGWLAINMWHNMQYILFVWLQNNHTYSKGIDIKHKLISQLSQNGNFIKYMAVCLFITFFLYQVLMAAGIIFSSLSMVSFAAVSFMTLNFHHYIVDAIIWKRKPVKVTT